MVSPISSSEIMLGKTIPVLELLLAALRFIVTGQSVGLLVSTVSRTRQEAFMTTFRREVR